MAAILEEGLVEEHGQILSRRDLKKLKISTDQRKEGAQRVHNKRKALNDRLLKNQIEETKRYIAEEFDCIKRSDFSGIAKKGSDFLPGTHNKDKKPVNNVIQGDLLPEYREQMKIHAEAIEAYFETITKTLPLEQLRVRYAVFDLIDAIYSRYSSIFNELEQKDPSVRKTSLADNYDQNRKDQNNYRLRAADQFYHCWIQCGAETSPFKERYAVKAYTLYAQASQLLKKVGRLDDTLQQNMLALEKAGVLDSAHKKSHCYETPKSEAFSSLLEQSAKIRDEVTALIRCPNKDDTYKEKLGFCLSGLEKMIRKTKSPDFAEIAIFLEPNRQAVLALLKPLQHERQAIKRMEEAIDTLLQWEKKKQAAFAPQVPAPVLAAPLLLSDAGKECVAKPKASAEPTAPVQNRTKAELLYVEALEAIQKKEYASAEALFSDSISIAKQQQERFVQLKSSYGLADTYKIDAQQKTSRRYFAVSLILLGKATETAQDTRELCQGLLVNINEKSGEDKLEAEEIERIKIFSTELLEDVQKYAQDVETKMQTRIENHEKLKAEREQNGTWKTGNPSGKISSAAEAAHFCRDHIREIQALRIKTSEYLAKDLSKPEKASYLAKAKAKGKK